MAKLAEKLQEQKRRQVQLQQQPPAPPHQPGGRHEQYIPLDVDTTPSIAPGPPSPRERPAGAAKGNPPPLPSKSPPDSGSGESRKGLPTPPVSKRHNAAATAASSSATPPPPPPHKTPSAAKHMPSVAPRPQPPKKPPPTPAKPSVAPKSPSKSGYASTKQDGGRMEPLAPSSEPLASSSSPVRVLPSDVLPQRPPSPGYPPNAKPGPSLPYENVDYPPRQEGGGRGLESYQNVKSGAPPSRPYTNIDFTDVSQHHQAVAEGGEEMYMNLHSGQRAPKHRQPKRPVATPPSTRGQQRQHVNGGSAQPDSDSLYQNVSNTRKWGQR